MADPTRAAAAGVGLKPGLSPPNTSAQTATNGLLPLHSTTTSSGATLNHDITAQHAQPYQPQRERFQAPLHRIRTAFSNSGKHSHSTGWLSSQYHNLLSFFIATWLDWLTILAIGATAAGVWVAPHTFTRLFAVTDPSSGTIYWPELAYPYLDPIFSPAVAGIIAALIPIASFLVAQLWMHSFLDFGSAVLGLGYSMVTGTCFQVILKKTIGGLRPHFLAVCQPVIPAGLVGQGFNQIMYTAEEICTGSPDRIKNALESFPSGHAQIAFSGFGYLSIYLFCHLKISSPLRRHGSHWKLLLVIAPLLLATYLASTLVLGYHHPGDVIFGAFIGWTMAFLGYRTVFRGLLDPRWNTEPYLVLPPREGEGSQRRMEKKRDDDLNKNGLDEMAMRPPTNGTVWSGRNTPAIDPQRPLPV